MTRSFVKAVAMYTGLGFGLWLDEEEQERKAQAEADVYHDINKIRDRVTETITTIQKKSGMSLADIASKFNRSEAELKQYISMYQILYAVENNLNCILRELG